MYIEETTCCGVRELANISDADSAKHVVKDIADYFNAYDREEYKDDFRPFLIFTDIKEEGVKGHGYEYATKLIKYIKIHKLGKVIETESRINPNTGNRVKVYVWSVSKQGLLDWYNNK